MHSLQTSDSVSQPSHITETRCSLLVAVAMHLFLLSGLPLSNRSGNETASGVILLLLLTFTIFGALQLRSRPGAARGSLAAALILSLVKFGGAFVAIARLVASGGARHESPAVVVSYVLAAMTLSASAVGYAFARRVPVASFSARAT